MTSSDPILIEQKSCRLMLADDSPLRLMMAEYVSDQGPKDLESVNDLESWLSWAKVFHHRCGSVSIQGSWEW